jgi:mannose-6-phosphate isomerase class I
MSVKAPEITRMDRLPRSPNYDRAPFVEAGNSSDLDIGWDSIARRLWAAPVVVIDTYPGVHRADIAQLVPRLGPELAVCVEDALKPEDEIEKMIGPELSNDPVFGRLTSMKLEDFFDKKKLAQLKNEIAACTGRAVVYGTGASLVADGDLLVYADMARWEAQRRQRAGEIANLGGTDMRLDPTLKYKRAFFVDWRVADRHKLRAMRRADFILETGDRTRPKLAPAKVVRRALEQAAKRPFRVVPFFDPAPWGGQWMKTVCDLDRDTINYGWCFDCVPEENSLLLGFGGERFEIPSLNLVLELPRELLGDHVFERFGAEFPIRFDFLDTMDGGNLSLQVHPLTEYIREQFGMGYTQDESYYLLDADHDATVFLGLRKGTDPKQMVEDLKRAESGGFHFPATRYVNQFPAQRHDHFLIPAGTIHCSGANGLVLEISATPYIFTFKLWDWDRLGLNGRPRPVHVEHGMKSIQWDRDEEFARRFLINQFEEVASADGWREERTGLHSAEFIETRRHWFTGPAPHKAGFGVNVLNLVQGEEALIESPDREFDPFVVHYAETFIVPAAAGPYTIRPHGIAEATECATIKAFVRKDSEGLS